MGPVDDPVLSNWDASLLGEIARKAVKAPAGDDIDTGLVLHRLLKEKGYIVMTENRKPV